MGNKLYWDRSDQAELQKEYKKYRTAEAFRARYGPAKVWQGRTNNWFLAKLFGGLPLYLIVAEKIAGLHYVTKDFILSAKSGDKGADKDIVKSRFHDCLNKIDVDPLVFRESLGTLCLDNDEKKTLDGLLETLYLKEKAPLEPKVQNKKESKPEKKEKTEETKKEVSE